MGFCGTLNNTLAVMQPTYLPWVGYFDLIKTVDHFVFLDNVKFEKSSWQTRNKIPINNIAQFLTVPVLGSRSQLIKEVLINDEINWRRKHIKTLRQLYKKHTFGDWMLEIVIPIIDDKSIVYLSELNIKLIKEISNSLDLITDYSLASNIPTCGTKSLRLAEICKFFGIRNYYSPVGSKDYIEEENIFTENNIDVIYQNLSLIIYKQRGQSHFISHLSIIDLMANLGYQSTINYIEDMVQI